MLVLWLFPLNYHNPHLHLCTGLLLAAFVWLGSASLLKDWPSLLANVPRAVLASPTEMQREGNEIAIPMPWKIGFHPCGFWQTPFLLHSQKISYFNTRVMHLKICLRGRRRNYKPVLGLEFITCVYIVKSFTRDAKIILFTCSNAC
jgi:hypothetical protein